MCETAAQQCHYARELVIIRWYYYSYAGSIIYFKLLWGIQWRSKNWSMITCLLLGIANSWSLRVCLYGLVLHKALRLREKFVSAGILHFLCVPYLLERLFVPFPSVWKGLCVPLLKQVLHSLLVPLSTCFIETFLISRLYYLARFLREDSMDPHAPINEIPDTDFAWNDHPVCQYNDKCADAHITAVNICT